MFYVTLFFEGNIKYDDTELLNGIKPELKDGVHFFYTDKPFNLLTENFVKRKLSGDFRDIQLLGLYIPTINFVKVVVNESDMNMTKSIVCHELKHHEWYKMMTDEEKEFWEDLYLSDELIWGAENMNRWYGNANEYHSEHFEENLEECYN